MTKDIRVVIAGALGKMGIETAKAIDQDNELELVGLVDIRANGEKFSDLTGIRQIDLPVDSDLDLLIERTKPDILVDFTNPRQSITTPAWPWRIKLPVLLEPVV